MKIPDSQSASSFDDHLGSTNLFLGCSEMIHVNSLMSRWIPLKQVIKSWILYTIIQCHLETLWTHAKGTGKTRPTWTSRGMLCQMSARMSFHVLLPWVGYLGNCENWLVSIWSVFWLQEIDLGDQVWSSVGFTIFFGRLTCWLSIRIWPGGMLTSDGPGWCQEISARSLGAGHYSLRMLVVSSHLTGKGDDSNICISFAEAGLRLDFNHHWPVVVAIWSLKQASSTKHYLNKWSFFAEHPGKFAFYHLQISKCSWFPIW